MTPRGPRRLTKGDTPPTERPICGVNGVSGGGMIGGDRSVEGSSVIRLPSPAFNQPVFDVVVITGGLSVSGSTCLLW
jgi:hypothetical protein